MPPFRSFAVLLIALACAAAPVQAKSKKSKSTENSAIEKFQRGSAESGTERERRLSRECRGRPNAGACAGYTR